MNIETFEKLQLKEVKELFAKTAKYFEENKGLRATTRKKGHRNKKFISKNEDILW